MTDARWAWALGELWGDSAQTRTVGRELPGSVSDLQSPSASLKRSPCGHRGWRLLRRLGYAAYCAVLASIVSTYGVPTGRLSLAVMVVIGLALSGIGRGWRRTALVARDWLPFTALLVAYDQTRGLADALGMRLHEGDVLHAERWLFGGVEPTAWLQHRFYRSSQVSWYDAVATLVYTSHFLVTPLIAAVLWLRNRAEWLRFITRVMVLSVAGLITYGLFPEAPPWLAARDGLSKPVARLSARGWIWLHLDNVNSVLASAQSGGSNPVAAMPSLHTAFAVLVAIALVTRLHSKWRHVVVLYPVAMGLTLVYTGEHYVLDVVAGASYAVAVHVAVSRWEAGQTTTGFKVRSRQLLGPMRSSDASDSENSRTRSWIARLARSGSRSSRSLPCIPISNRDLQARKWLLGSSSADELAGRQQGESEL